MTTILIGTSDLDTAVPGAGLANDSLGSLVEVEYPAVVAEISQVTAIIVSLTLCLHAGLTLSASLTAQLAAQIQINAGIILTLALGPIGLFLQMVLQLTAPTFLIGLELALPTFIASLTASLSAGIALTASLAAQLTVSAAGTAAEIAQIENAVALLAELNARLPLLADAAASQAAMTSILQATDVTVYAFSGPLNTLGSEMASEIAGGNTGGMEPSGQTWAVVLATQVGPTWDAMTQVLRVS